MREERIVIAGRELLIARPDDPESLIDEARFDEDEFLPYWAELWPSGLALARYAATLDLAGRRVVELGCGLALPSFAAALAGADVVATDWSPEALALVTRNAAANHLRIATALVDWHAPPPPGISTFDVVLAADVLYEERNAVPVLGMLAATTAHRGTVLIADPGRRHSTSFFELADADGWLIDRLAAPELPSGGIAILSRAQENVTAPPRRG
jgi:predicted nicotinamide N-methyase